MNSSQPGKSAISRRAWMGSAAALAASVSALGHAAEEAPSAQAPAVPPKRDRKIKLGLIGCGGRCMFLTKHFRAHGGYEFAAVADYFDGVAQSAGEKLGVPANRRFSGLSGYKKLLDSGVEAAVIEDVPCFYPEQARAAVDAGLHVYIAKPVAVDVPGCLAIGAAGKEATRKQRCFLVDYQLPLQKACQEVAARVQQGALGRLAHIVSYGIAWHAWPDPPLTKTIESRLRDEIWLSDTNLGGDTLLSYDIHIIDGVLWATGLRPTAAFGRQLVCRPQPHGDRIDAASVIYECQGGVIWTHVTQAIDNEIDLTTNSASLCGMTATAHLQYGGKNYVRGGKKHYSGKCDDIYVAGAVTNIADFYQNIVEGRFENPTVQRAVDGTLTAILGREAAARGGRLTMEELLKENKRLPVNLEGLKA